MRKLLLLILLSSMPLAAQTLTGVSISPRGASLQTGSTYQFTATCTYSSGPTDNCAAAGGVSWVSSRSTATVSSTGLVTAVTDPGAGGVGYSIIVATAGSFKDRIQVMVQHPGDTWYQYPTPDFHFYKDTETGAQLPLNVAVGSTVAIGSGVLANYAAGFGTGTSYSACNWASSDVTKATVDNQGFATAIAPGTVDITCGVLGDAAFGTSSQSGWIPPGNVLTLTIVAGGTGSTTWYVRPDGGTPYTNATDTPAGQCDGKHDASYASTGGTGVNQPCAMGNLRDLWADQTTNKQLKWMIAGGDTVIVRQKSAGYTIGADNTGGSVPTNCGGDAGACYMPTIPSGSASQHTRILGENYASCTSDSAKTLLYETWYEYAGFNTKDSQFVDVACFEITDTASCGGSGNFINTCPGSGMSPGQNGVFQTALTASVNYTDLFIHGLTNDGIKGASGIGDVATRVHIRAMPDAGVNMDDNPWLQGNISLAGGWTMNDSVTEFVGCVEMFPITLNYPYIECRDQSAGGYADGFGTASAAGDWSFDHDLWQYNYSDGLDLLHSGLNNLVIKNSDSHGNDGQQYKIGSGRNVQFINNLTLHNCMRVGTLFGDEPSSAIVPAPNNKHTVTGLSITYANGVMVSGFGVTTTTPVTGGTFTMTANTVNYVWVDPTTFTVMQNATGFPGGLNSHYRIAAITTNATGIAPNGYSDYAAQFTLCRAAGDGIALAFDGQGTDVFAHNTYVGYGATSYDMGCSGWDSCTAANTSFIDNINIGILNTNYLDGNGAQVGLPGLFYSVVPMPANQGWATRTYNQYYNFKGGTGCPSTMNTGELCSNALFVNQPPLTISSELTLDGYDFNLTSSSLAKYAGIPIAGITTDRTGAPYATPNPSMGPLEFGTTPPSATTTMNGHVVFSGNVRF